MASRLELQAELEEILGSDHVYFQPPESISIKYPAIVYRKQAGFLRHADNRKYLFRTCYLITAIDYDPDANWGEKLTDHFEFARLEREYTSGNLNHWPVSIYY